MNKRPTEQLTAQDSDDGRIKCRKILRFINIIIILGVNNGIKMLEMGTDDDGWERSRLRMLVAVKGLNVVHLPTNYKKIFKEFYIIFEFSFEKR